MEETTGLANFIAYAKKLTNIQRWNTEFLYHKASVAEHSYSVAQIAQCIGIIEQKHGKKIDWAKLYRKAINHDIKESCTGDILHNTKHKKEEVNKALNIIETELSNEYILSKIDNVDYRQEVENIINEDKDDTLEGKILSAADMIDAMLECQQEIKLGNVNPFKERYHYLEKKLYEIDLISIKLFLTEILPAFQ